MADEKGTGKHPHKSTEEPYPHHGSESSGENRGEERRESRSENRGSETRGSSEGGPSSETRDLKEREYRDKEGNIHHHTHTSSEMRGDEKKAA